MSKVVDLLERIGRSSRLQALTSEQLAQELARTGVEPAVQAAIVQQRARQLEELSGASRNVCCLIHAPQDDEPEEQQPDDDKRFAAAAQPGAERRVVRAS